MISHPSIPNVSLGPDIPHNAREWRNHPDIRKWCRQHTLISVAHHNAWIERIKTDESIKMFSIEANGVSVGVTGLTSINRINQTAEFSLYIAPPYQRRGYARGALTLLLMHGFWEQNLNRIWGETFEGNPARNLFIDIGMRWEGLLEDAYYREGRFIHCNLFAMTKKGFNKKYDYLRHSSEPDSASDEPLLVQREPGVDSEKAYELAAHSIKTAVDPFQGLKERFRRATTYQGSVGTCNSAQGVGESKSLENCNHE